MRCRNIPNRQLAPRSGMVSWWGLGPRQVESSLTVPSQFPLVSGNLYHRLSLLVLAHMMVGVGVVRSCSYEYCNGGLRPLLPALRIFSLYIDTHRLCTTACPQNPLTLASRYLMLTFGIISSSATIGPFLTIKVSVPSCKNELLTNLLLSDIS